VQCPGFFKVLVATLGVKLDSGMPMQLKEGDFISAALRRQHHANTFLLGLPSKINTMPASRRSRRIGISQPSKESGMVCYGF